MPPISRLPESTKRIPRKFSESPTFRPEWRSLQVAEYRAAAANLTSGGSYPAPPLWESDKIVREYYRYRSVGSGSTPSSTEVLRWVQECHDTNSQHGFGSRIKAFYLAKMMPAEISEEIGVSRGHVETYLNLFFDVQGILHNQALVSNLIRPFSAVSSDLYSLSDSDKMDRTMMVMGYFCGADVLRAFANFNVGAQRDIIDEFDSAITANAYLSGAAWAMLERASRAPNSKDLDRALSLKRTRAEERKADGSGSPLPGQGGMSQEDASSAWLASISEEYREVSGSGGRAHERDIPSIDDLRSGKFIPAGEPDLDLPDNVYPFRRPGDEEVRPMSIKIS